MTRVLAVIRLAVTCSGFLLGLTLAHEAAAQSLYLEPGQRALDATVGWSVGPSSDGIETTVAVAFDGRVDAGVAFNRYDVDFGDGTGATFREYAPFVRYFAVKEGRDGRACQPRAPWSVGYFRSRDTSVRVVRRIRT
jgi:hypothetical protein